MWQLWTELVEAVTEEHMIMIMMMMMIMLIMLMVSQWGCDWSISARCVVSRFSTRREIRWNLCLILTRRLSVSVEELTSTSLLYVILSYLSLLHTCVALALWNSAPAAIKVPNFHSGETVAGPVRDMLVVHLLWVEKENSPNTLKYSINQSINQSIICYGAPIRPSGAPNDKIS